MFKIIIKKDNVITHGAKFETEEKALEWFNKEKQNGSFGKNESVEVIPQVLDENNVEISPAQEIIHPAEYTHEIVDISLEIQQQQINAEALEYLASTDWMIVRELETGVQCPVEIKQLRQAARARIVR